MKLRKNWKRFFSLNRHHAEGFTLVELIVVIAILAILGGVAVPAYSGYVAKAERAGDEQLLAAVNTAFASACAINGEDHYNRNDVEITLTGDAGARQIATIEPVNDAFWQFFEGGEFAVFTDLYYSRILGGFAENASHEFSYAGTTIYLTSEDIANLANSTFGEIGMGELLGKVDQATAYALAADPNSTLGKLIAAQEGILIEQLGEDSWWDTVIARATLLAAKDGVTFETEDELINSTYLDTAVSDVNANNALLNAATNTSAAITEDFITQLKNGQVKDAIKENAADAGATMAQTAFAYGLYTSYCADRGIAISNQLDHSVVLDVMASSDFMSYMASEQAQTDMDGYMSAMNMINTNAKDNDDAISNILVNGFSDPELVTLLQQAAKGSN